jgi:acyl-CoA thioesterase YciA
MSTILSKKIVMAKDIGVHGNLFGGILMAWMDEAAASLATEFCKTPNMVTVRIGELIFKKPLKAGNHLRIYGEISHIGNTSITIRLEAKRYNLYSGEEVVVCDTNSTFVRVDDDGTPVPIDDSVRKNFEK